MAMIVSILRGKRVKLMRAERVLAPQHAGVVCEGWREVDLHEERVRLRCCGRVGRG